MKPVSTNIAHREKRLKQKIRAIKNRKVRQEIAAIQDTTAKIRAVIGRGDS